MNTIDRFSPDVIHGYYIDGNVYDDGERIPAIRKSFSSACILEATVATTGLMGGDSGHGGRTVLRLVDKGGTDIKVVPVRNGLSNGGLELHFGGDCELLNLIDALRFSADALEELADLKE